MTKSEGYISLSRKAGRIQIGEANAKAAAEKGRAVLLIITNDVSQPTKERAMRMAERFHLPVCVPPIGKDELAGICGKCGCMAAFTDAGLAAAYASALALEDGSFAPLAELLAERAAKPVKSNKKMV